MFEKSVSYCSLKKKWFACLTSLLNACDKSWYRKGFLGSHLSTIWINSPNLSDAWETRCWSNYWCRVLSKLTAKSCPCSNITKMKAISIYSELPNTQYFNKKGSLFTHMHIATKQNFHSMFTSLYFPSRQSVYITTILCASMQFLLVFNALQETLYRR